MTPANQPDLGPLTWIRSEIDASLERAATELDNASVAEQPEDALRLAQNHVHQARGALAIVELEGLTRFIDAVDHQIGLAARSAGTNLGERISLIRRCLDATSNYLEDLMSGAPDQPLRLARLYDELLVLGVPGEALDLFLPDLGIRAPRLEADAECYVANLQALRAHFQRGLLDWLRQPKNGDALLLMGKVVARLERAYISGTNRTLWWIVRALFEALLRKRNMSVAELRPLFQHLDAHMRRQQLNAAAPVPDRLLREALYAVTRHAPSSAHEKAVWAQWSLETLVPEEGADISDKPLAPMLQDLRNRLNTAKESWDKFCEGKAAEAPQALMRFHDEITSLIEPAGGLGRPAIVRLLNGLASFAAWLRSDPLRHDDSIALEVATTLLLADAALQRGGQAGIGAQVTDMLGRLDTLRRGEALAQADQSATAQGARRAQEREALGQLSSEIRISLGEVEVTLDDFFRDPGKRAALANLSGPIHLVQGALNLLDDEAPIQLLRNAAKRIEQLAAGTEVPDPAEAGELAHQLSALGFYIEALQHGEARLDDFLSSTPVPRIAPSSSDDEEEVLVTQSSARPPVVEATERTDAPDAAAAPQPTDDDIVATDAGDGLDIGHATLGDEATEEADSQPPVVPQAIETPVADALPTEAPSVTPSETGEDRRADDKALAPATDVVAAPPATPGGVTLPVDEPADDDLLEIFIEEAHDVLGNISRSLDAVRRNLDNMDELTVIRRGFHTLKGSGRMVGLARLGEVAWVLEQSMNRWLQREWSATTALLSVIAQAHECFADWVAALEQGQLTQPTPNALMAAALRLREEDGNTITDDDLAVIADGATTQAADAPATEAPAATDEVASPPAPDDEEPAPAATDDAADALADPGDLAFDAGGDLGAQPDDLAGDDDAAPLDLIETSLEFDSNLSEHTPLPGIDEALDSPSFNMEETLLEPQDAWLEDRASDAAMPPADTDAAQDATPSPAAASELSDDAEAAIPTEFDFDLGDAEMLDIGDAGDAAADAAPASTPEADTDKGIAATPEGADAPPPEFPEISDATLSATDDAVSIDTAGADIPAQAADTDTAPADDDARQLDAVNNLLSDIDFSLDDHDEDLATDPDASMATSADTPDSSWAPDDGDQAPTLDFERTDTDDDTSFVAATDLTDNDQQPVPEGAVDVPATPELAQPGESGALTGPTDNAVSTERPDLVEGFDLAHPDAPATDVSDLMSPPGDPETAVDALVPADDEAADLPPIADTSIAHDLVDDTPESVREIADPEEAAAAPSSALVEAEATDEREQIAEVDADADVADAEALSEPATETPPVPALDPDNIRLGDFELSRALFELFLDEASQHQQTLQHEIDRLQAQPGAIPSELSIRAAHTLAGIAGTARVNAAHHLGRAFEHALGRLHNLPAPPVDAERNTLSEALRRLGEMLEQVRGLQLPADAEALIDTLEQVGRGGADAATTEDLLAAPHGIPAEAMVPPSAEDAIPPAPEPADDDGLGELTERRVGGEAAPDDDGALGILAALPTTEKDDIDTQLLPIFLEEGAELITGLSSALRTLGDAPDDAGAIRLVARQLHTLKGSARMTGAMNLGQHVHHMETFFEPCQQQGAATRETVETLEYALDLAERAISRLAGNEPEEAPAPAEASARSAAAAPAAADLESETSLSSASLRVRADTVDGFVNQAGEIGILRTRIESELRSSRRSLLELTENVIRLRNQLREVEIQAEVQLQSRMAQAESRHAEFDPLEMDRFTRLQELTRMMAESVNDVTTVQQNLLRGLDSADLALHNQARMSRELQQSLMQVRMVPFDSLADRLYRVVRQSARDLGKRAHFELRGGRIELDRSVLEHMAAPLEHLLRNSVAHGIEGQERRKTLGKSETGEIILDVHQEGNEIVIDLSDDGSGLDFERIAQRARESGLISEREQLDQGQLTNLIFMPGFSTAGGISQVSGRGVGMDVVKTETAAAGGRIETTSITGKGTRFRIYLPLTLAVTQAVLVDGASRRWAIPSTMVVQALELKEATLSALKANGGFDWQGDFYPYHYLPQLLGDREALPEQQRLTWVLLLRSGDRRMSLQVDGMRGNQEIVVKNAGPQIARLVGVSGATVMGDGEVVLILNPPALLGRLPARGDATQTPALQTAVHTPTVMVVDDSLTVRKITGRLLEREGYMVSTAKDGVDALEKLTEALPDVVLSDIEMPRMDGFDLLRNIRADARMKTLPVIMITSRLAEKHRRYAAEIGANHYLGKPYQEDELLALIGRYAPLNSGH